MKGVHRLDPVAKLDLEGRLAGMIDCPYMVTVKRWRSAATRPCGAQASLYVFPEPYGLRSYCEEDHVCALSPLMIPVLMPGRKGPTD